ncbi:MAG: nucleoside triphosphate pyrophosphohydrolase [gamma proteobacterium symbiont of Taylorina sp.]|nr:nucleoside triphosphate pyrophosphohydrolase [gamma proteobacterium symbiont of Taylorina sp.]
MKNLQRLLDIMSSLRDPEKGCPWDLQQNYQSLVSYTLEEAYEVAEAIELGDMDEVKKELGDLLFQVVFYAQLAKEEGLFEFDDIASAIADKMVARHPHVFSDHQYENEAVFLKAWEQQKETEKPVQLSAKSDPLSLMDGISQALPAMTRAVKIQKKATHIGFDWDSAEAVLPKIQEELDELLPEIKSYEAKTIEHSKQKIEDELGDVLFSCVNLARKLKIDPEKALRRSNHKFIQRFKKLEQHYQYDRNEMENTSLDQLEHIWQKIKQ